MVTPSSFPPPPPLFSNNTANASSQQWSPRATQYLELLHPTHPPTSPTAIQDRLRDLRQLILLESLPQAPAEAAAIRPLVWKLLLRLHEVPKDTRGDVHPLLNADTYGSLTCVLLSDLLLPPQTRRGACTVNSFASPTEFERSTAHENRVQCSPRSATIRSVLWPPIKSFSTRWERNDWYAVSRRSFGVNSVRRYDSVALES